MTLATRTAMNGEDRADRSPREIYEAPTRPSPFRRIVSLFEGRVAEQTGSGTLGLPTFRAV
jgi:hypothetical protein